MTDLTTILNMQYVSAHEVLPNDLFLTRDENGEEMDTVMTGASGLFKNCLNLSGTIPANLLLNS